MKTEELLLIGAALFGAYLLLHKAPPPVVTSFQQQPQVPVPAQSPYWGFPPNIQNPSASANNGQSWSTQDTAAIIGAVGGISSSLINAYA